MVKTAYDIGRDYAIKTAGLNLLPAIERAAPALDVAGLGMLAAPTANDLIDPPWIQTEKRRNRARMMELAGLGTLAIPSIAKLLAR